MTRFRLISLGGITFDEEVYEVVLPTAAGQIGVLERHMPLISVATNGVVMVRRREGDPDAQAQYFAISGGVLEVADNTLSLLVDEADIGKDRAAAEAEQAKMRARHLQENADEQISLEKAGAMIDRQAVRLQVAGLKRRHRRG